MWINIDIEKKEPVVSFSDKIGSISLEFDNKNVVISGGGMKKTRFWSL